MLLTTFQEIFCVHVDNREDHARRVWAFDRLRLCEMGFDRHKLRFPNISKVSIKACNYEK